MNNNNLQNEINKKRLEVIYRIHNLIVNSIWNNTNMDELDGLLKTFDDMTKGISQKPKKEMLLKNIRKSK